MKYDRNNILGINAFNHDSSACLISGDEVIAFCEEERFNDIKHTSAYPARSIEYCLNLANYSISDIDYIVYYFNPKKCLWNYFKYNNPLFFFIDPTIFIRKRFYYELIWLLNFINQIFSIYKYLPGKKINFVDHHIAHIWYGYYTSNFKNCTVLSNDSMGEDISCLAMKFNTNNHGEISCKKIFSQNDPHSLGYLYGAITEYLGFKRGDGEGRVMALSGLGSAKYLNLFNNSIQFLSRGRFRIKNSLILKRNFQPRGKRLSDEFIKRFGQPKKSIERFNQNHYDISFALQNITEKIVMHQVNALGIENNLVLTGGVAQNSVLNGKLANFFSNKNIFIPPIPNDAGCSIGAAIYLYYKLNSKMPKFKETAFLGPKFNDDEILKIIDNNKLKYEIITEPISFLSEELCKNKVIAVFRDNMECGPRALGNRSILASPINAWMKDYLNKKVKYREKFRPYGGIILDKYVKSIFDHRNNSIFGPYMSFVFPVRKEWINKIPAIVHVDQTSRVQIIKEDQDYFLENLLKVFYEKSGVPVIINTSLNTSGFPIAREPQDAINAFYNSAIDYLLFNNHILITK